MRIYHFGYERYGEEQADKYYNAFFERFNQIAEQPFLYPCVDYICDGYRRSVCESDCIYYRVVDGVVEIMTIIGQQDFA